MSLMINVDEIGAVLLADGWHEVARTGYSDDDPSSFDLDSYEFCKGNRNRLLVGGGQVDGVPSTGFRFTEAGDLDGQVVYGPLTAVLAVRTYPVFER